MAGALLVVLVSAALRIDPEGRVALPFTAITLPELCTFHRLSGLPCPACGLTRSFIAAAHLDLRAALAHNPVGPLLFAFVAAQIPARLIVLLKPRTAEVLLRHRLIRAYPWIVVSLMACWWVWRTVVLVTARR